MNKHWKRLGLTLQGRYTPDHPSWPEDRQSGYKGYLGEVLHSVTNLWVEGLRSAGSTSSSLMRCNDV